jgi:hypothetical protein
MTADLPSSGVLTNLAPDPIEGRLDRGCQRNVLGDLQVSAATDQGADAGASNQVFGRDYQAGAPGTGYLKNPRGECSHTRDWRSFLGRSGPLPGGRGLVPPRPASSFPSPARHDPGGDFALPRAISSAAERPSRSRTEYSALSSGRADPADCRGRPLNPQSSAVVPGRERPIVELPLQLYAAC